MNYFVETENIQLLWELGTRSAIHLLQVDKILKYSMQSYLLSHLAFQSINAANIPESVIGQTYKHSMANTEDAGKRFPLWFHNSNTVYRPRAQTAGWK